SKAFRDAEILVRAEIPSCQARTDQHVAAGVAERVNSRRGEASELIPTVNRPLTAGQIAIATAVRALERAGVVRGRGHRDGEGHSGLRGDDVAKLPSSGQRIHHA